MAVEYRIYRDGYLRESHQNTESGWSCDSDAWKMFQSLCEKEHTGRMELAVWPNDGNPVVIALRREPETGKPSDAESRLLKVLENENYSIRRAIQKEPEFILYRRDRIEVSEARGPTIEALMKDYERRKNSDD